MFSTQPCRGSWLLTALGLTLVVAALNVAFAWAADTPAELEKKRKEQLRKQKELQQQLKEHEDKLRERRKYAPFRDEQRQFRAHIRSWLEVRTENIVMQQRDYSCGAAALATMMRIHWGDKSITELSLLREVVKMLTREEMKERIENGLSLTDLRRLAVRQKYLATIGRLSFAKLRESKVPLIVGIIVNKFDHFVVYRGMDDKYVYLADPARGHVRTPHGEFKKQWQKNAVLVVVRPGVSPTRKSPVNVTETEKSLGLLNNYYLRDRVSELPFGAVR